MVVFVLETKWVFTLFLRLLDHGWVTVIIYLYLAEIFSKCKTIKKKYMFLFAAPMAQWHFNSFLFLFFLRYCHRCATKSDVPQKYSVWWRIGNFLSGWRLSPFYVALGVALLMWPNALWLSSVAGIQLIILAILRLLTIFRFDASRSEGLLPKQSNKHHRDYFDKWVMFVTFISTSIKKWIGQNFD